MNITIIQSSRLGDIVQTFPALRILKEIYPDSRLNIFVWSPFRDALSHIEYIDEIYCYDNEELKKALKSDKNIIEKYNTVYRFLKNIANMPKQDLLINLSVSNEAGHIIASLIPAKKRIGPFITENRNRIILDEYSGFFVSTGMARRYNRMNLVDIHNLYTEAMPLKKVYKPSIKIDIHAEERLSEILGDMGIDMDKGCIGMVFGASDKRKQWNPEGYGILADMIASKFNHNIILIGSRGEHSLGEKIRSISENNSIYNLAGKTDIKMLFALISKMRLIISNDTGPMHIASMMNIPVINISVGCIYFRETGPYSSRSYIIIPSIDCFPCPFDYRCPHLNCHKLIKPEYIYQISKKFITGEDTLCQDCQDMDGIIVYKGVFSSSGIIDYLPLVPFDIDPAEIVSILLFQSWMSFLKVCDSDIDEYKFIQKYYKMSFDPDMLEELMLVRVNIANFRNSINRAEDNISPYDFVQLLNKDLPEYLLPITKYTEIMFKSRISYDRIEAGTILSKYRRNLILFLSNFLEKIDKLIDSMKQSIGIEV